MPNRTKELSAFLECYTEYSKKVSFRSMIYIYTKGTSFVEGQNAILSRPIFVIRRDQKAMKERERER